MNIIQYFLWLSIFCLPVSLTAEANAAFTDNMILQRDAKIVEDTVVVSAAALAKPVAIRYA